MIVPGDLLAGRTAAITGAGAGIGRGIAEVFARAGAAVAILEIDPERARTSASAIEAAGGRALAVPVDVRDGGALAGAVDLVEARLGAIDVLVNNVGGTFRATFLDTVEKGWDALVRLNLKTVLHGVRLVAPRMIARGAGGNVLNIVTIEGVRAAPQYAVYAACKAAVMGVTQSLAVELAPHQIRVNAIAPDICLTEGLEAMLGPAERERHRFLVPLGRAGVPDDIAGPALFLVSELARYVTGVTLHVDGGTHAAGGWYRDPDGTGWLLGPPPRRA